MSSSEKTLLWSTQKSWQLLSQLLEHAERHDLPLDLYTRLQQAKQEVGQISEYMENKKYHLIGRIHTEALSVLWAIEAHVASPETTASAPAKDKTPFAPIPSMPLGTRPFVLSDYPTSGIACTLRAQIYRRLALYHTTYTPPFGASMKNGADVWNQKFIDTLIHSGGRMQLTRYQYTALGMIYPGLNLIWLFFGVGEKESPDALRKYEGEFRPIQKNAIREAKKQGTSRQEKKAIEAALYAKEHKLAESLKERIAGVLKFLIMEEQAPEFFVIMDEDYIPVEEE